jgi:transcriptional regulator with GAF, ATPase, and Fis domain
MSSLSSSELKGLYEVSRLPLPKGRLQDYFDGVMAILSEYFTVAYSALILHDSKKNSFHVEALFGIDRDIHPYSCTGLKGTIGKVLETRQPAVIQNLAQEPLYEEMIKGAKKIEKIRAPLLCVPLVVDGNLTGVININPLYGSRDEFLEDFQFLSVLTALLSPAIRDHQTKGNPKPKSKTSLLDEILEEKLSEVLNKIDPYVESKTRMGIFNDIISVVEKILIKSALRRVGNVQIAAAQFLGINRNTLRKKMKELKIKIP